MTKGARQVISILPVVGFVALLVVVGNDLYWFIFRHRGVEYYQRAPYMFFDPTGVAFLVGLAVWMFSRLPRENQRWVSLWGWGVSNVVGMCFAAWCFYMGYAFFQLERVYPGRIAPENAGATQLKYLFTMIAIVSSAALSLSWRRLYLTVGSMRRRPAEGKQPE